MFRTISLQSKSTVNQLSNYTKSIFPGVSKLTKLLVDRGQGSYVHDAISDTNYLDLTSGIAVTNTGHCHPKVVDAIVQQAKQLIHGQANIFYHKPMLELTKELLDVLPSKSLDTLFFTNSGSEAVEGAVKLARHATKRNGIVAFQGSFHGRTLGTLSLTSSKTIYSKGFGPLLPSIYFSPFPYPSQVFGPEKKQLNDREVAELEAKASEHCLRQLDLIFQQTVAPEDCAAMIIEPVLGEGGYYPAPPQFLSGLRERCDKHGILFIVDEIQSGFCRSGSFFSIEKSGVRPDILIMAKGLASGMPLSAIAASSDLSKLQPPGSMGGTYSGNPISCAAALATLQVIHNENILENVHKRLNDELISMLNNDGRYHVHIRGSGLMIGIEFFRTDSTSESASKLSPQICEYLHKNLNTLVMNTSCYDTLRLMPPLIINEEECKIAVDNLLEAVKATLTNIR